MEEMYNFVIFLGTLKANLTGREIKYLIWRFVYKKTDKEIARLDGRRISRSAVSFIICKTYKKIKLYSGNSYGILE